MNVSAHPRLAERISEDAQQRLAAMISAISADPSAIDRLFPAAAREVARGALDPDDPEGLIGPTLDDAVRGVLLTTLADAEPAQTTLLRRVRELYRLGDSDEKRAVLRALPELRLGPDVLAIVEDALRTNDRRLIGAAMGSWAGRHLDDSTWRHGVLKCLFTGVPLAAVARLRERSDAELVRMVAALAHEHLAAGRAIPPDVRRVLAIMPDVLEQFPDVRAALAPVSPP